MSDGDKRSIFVLGYGNPGRQDDGLGPKAAERVESLGLPSVTTDAAFQLAIEDAEAISGHDIVVFVDASLSAPAPFLFERVYPADEVTFTSHSVSPGSIMKLCADHFGPAPQAWVMGIRGYSFEFEEGLTDAARRNLEEAMTFLSGFLLQNYHMTEPVDSKPMIEPTSHR
jgi:hydrogenase maturation protease